MDKLVGKLGLHDAITLLEHVTTHRHQTVNGKLKYKLIATFIQSRCARAFEFDESEFGLKVTREHRESRMAGFHLLKKYTDASYSKIGKDYGLHKRQAIYACQKCEELLSSEAFYSVFCDKYRELEREVIAFIGHLYK